MSEYIAKYDVCVSLESMPLNIKSLIKRIGDYDCIVINDNLSDEAKEKAFRHELEHKYKNDLDRELLVKMIEEENKYK